MGIIILPFLLGAIVAFIIAVIQLIRSLLKNNVKLTEFIGGLILSSLIYTIIFIDYKSSDSVWALGTYFMFPFYMVYLPFAIGLATQFSSGQKTKSVSKIFMFSVIFSGLFIAAFYKYTFNLPDVLNLPKHY